MNKAIIEALKELARTAILAAITVTIPQLEAGKLDYKLILVAVVIAVLRGLEKYGYEMDKAGEDGLKLPF